MISTLGGARDGAAVSAPAPRPRSSSRDAVKRLVASLRLLEERRRRREQFAAMLTQLQGANLVMVAGEEGLLAAVDSRLEEASQILDALENDAAAIGDTLRELGAVLDGYEWEVLDGVMPVLSQEGRGAGRAHPEVAGRRRRVDVAPGAGAHAEIDEALGVRAPVARERAAVDRMSGLVDGRPARAVRPALPGRQRSHTAAGGVRGAAGDARRAGAGEDHRDAAFQRARRGASLAFDRRRPALLHCAAADAERGRYPRV